VPHPESEYKRTQQSEKVALSQSRRDPAFAVTLEQPLLPVPSKTCPPSTRVQALIAVGRNGRRMMELSFMVVEYLQGWSIEVKGAWLDWYLLRDGYEKFVDKCRS
jgi:hypothetical protein